MNNKLFKFLTPALLLVMPLVVSCGNTPSSQTSYNNSGNVWGPWGDWNAWGDDFSENDPSNGYNTIDYSVEYEDYTKINQFDATRTMKFAPHQGVHRYEAENAILSGEANTNEGGYYVGFLDNSTVRLSVEVTENCKALLVGSFSGNPDSTYGHRFNEQYSLIVNDKTIDTEDCWIQETGGWTTFRENPIAAIDLKTGVNTIDFYSSVGMSNIDYFVLSPVKNLNAPCFNFKNDLKIEVEDCRLNTCVIENGASGFNIGFTDADTTIEMMINSDKNRVVDFTFNGAILTNESNSSVMSNRLSLIVNNTKIAFDGQTFSGSSDANAWWQSYNNYSLGKINLHKGDNIISLKISESFNIDYFQISE